MITIKDFKSGEVIIKENDFGELSYLITQGRVRVSKKMEEEDVNICDLNNGDIFGEMSIIDDKPRSATITAIEDTTVRIIHRDLFFTLLQQKHGFAVNILKILFERLRKADSTIAMLKSKEPKSTKCFKPLSSKSERRSKSFIFLEGLTMTAAKALPSNPFQIVKFHFYIGRKSRDPLAHNDLMIKDKQPYRISRHHMEIDKFADEVFVLDRGSYLGTKVGDIRLGGARCTHGPVQLKGTDITVVLGGRHSPYRYKIIYEL